MLNERFIELAKMFLKYSLDEINYEYDFLTNFEKKLISKEEFEIFVDKIKE